MVNPTKPHKATIRRRSTLTFLLMHHFMNAMGSFPIMAHASVATGPSSLFRRNLNVMWLEYKSRGQHHLSHPYRSNRLPSKELRTMPQCAFMSTFSCNKSAFTSRSKARIQTTPTQSPYPCLSPWKLPNIFRQSTSLFNSYAPSNTNIKEELSERIPPGITIYDALQSSLKLLEDHSIPEPDESVLHLLSHALNLSWENGYRQLRSVSMLPQPIPSSLEKSKPSQKGPILDLAQQTLTSEQCTAYHLFLERRLQFEPLQYIVGQWDFHYLTGLKIRKPMLCPRPETEELVELVLKDIDHLIQLRQLQNDINPDECEKRKIRVLDVGCGTGAIGIAIAHTYPNDVQVVALDVLPEAVELSNENAYKFLSDKVGVNDDGEKEDVGSLYNAILCSAEDFTNINTIQSTGTTAAARPGEMFEMDFDIIVSNPPYIPTKDMQDLSTDVVGHEDHGALCGGDDGLSVIRDIVHRLPEWVASTDAGQKRGEPSHYCWMEVDDSHPSMMAEWLAPGSEESIRWGVEYSNGCKDFCGRDRFVKLRVLDQSK